MRKILMPLSLLTLMAIFSLLLSCSKDSSMPGSEDVAIDLIEDEITLEIGKEHRLVATFEPSDTPNKAHVWASDDPSIATVDETGMVKGLSVGKTVITVRALANNTTARCVVNVLNKVIPVSSITINSTKETLTIGSTLQLTAAVLPSNATDRKLKWSSNNSAVVSIDNNGLVKAIESGNARITASAGGKSVICEITVVERSVDFSNISYKIMDAGLVHISGKINPQGLKLSEIGICFSISNTPTIATNKIVLPLSLDVNSQLNDLKPNTDYYVRIYAMADNEVFYGKTELIQTPQTISTNFQIYELSIDLRNKPNVCGMRMTTPVIKGVNSLKICYGVAPKPEITDNITTTSTNSSGEGNYNLYIYDLKPATTYYYRAYELINNKPVYYNTEGIFSTIGKDVFFSATTNSPVNSNPWIFKVDYTLPEGDYEVSVLNGEGSIMPSYLSKTDDNWSFLIYVKGGKGNINVKVGVGTTASGIRSALESVRFKNLETGIEYWALIGRDIKK